MAKYVNMSDEERERYNLPPAGFQGNEMTVVIQAPSKDAMTKKIKAFHKFAMEEKYENFQILMEAPDPDGGYKAIVTAHNLNPVTWASEQFHRAKRGVQTGWEQGRKMAEVRSQISQQGQLAAAQAHEIAIQRARVARIAAAAPERQLTEEMVGREAEIARRRRRLAPYRGQVEQVEGELIQPRQTIEEYVFGTNIP